MFKDIRLSIDSKKIEFEYKVEGKKISINSFNGIKGSNLKIFYDENVYEIKFKPSTKIDNMLPGEIYLNLKKDNISFNINLKDNFFVKSVYKFINGTIDKKTLIEEINIFINNNSRKKINEDLNNLLLDIDNNDKELGELIIDNQDEYKRIFDILVKNKTYLSFAKKMNLTELMLLITSYIYAPYTPKVDQDTFNALVEAAINYNHSCENVWRIAMNYDRKDYNYDLIDSFFVNSKNIWYLGEYLSGVLQIDKEKIVNMIVDTSDKDYINQVIGNSMIMGLLDDNCKNILNSNK